MEIRKRGSVWYLDHFTNGKRTRMALSSDYQAAKEIARRIVGELDRKQWGIAKEASLGEICKAFLDYCKSNVAPRTATRYEDATNHLTKFFKSEGYDPASMKAGHVSMDLIERYKAQRLEKRRPKTVNNELAVARRMFNVAKTLGLTGTNPLENVRLLKVDHSKPPRFLSEQEIQQLVKAARPDDSDRMLFLVHTGLRLGEMQHLEWEDVDFDQGQIKIQSKKDWHTKSHQSRVIPMHQVVRDILERLKEKKTGAQVFAQETRHAFHHRLVKLSKRIKMKPVNPHVLRHTFASQLVMRGVDLVTVKTLLGHSDIRTTLTYAHLAQDHVRRAVEKLNLFGMAQVTSIRVASAPKSGKCGNP